MSDDDRLVERLGHVIDSQRCHAGCSERFHFYTRGACGGYCGENFDAAGDDFCGDFDVGNGDWMGHGDEVGGALGGLDAGETGDFQRVALGVGGQGGEDGWGELDEGGGGGLAAGGGLGGDVDHAGLAVGVVVGEGLMRHG